MLWLMAYLGIVALLVPHIRKGSTEASVARSMLLSGLLTTLMTASGISVPALPSI